ncbi:MAG TPA: hypothetical protein VEI97_09780, partial [bacterium]|nr:hypothetical protein [bacterium]
IQVVRTTSFEPYRLYRAFGGQRAQDDPRHRAGEGSRRGGWYQRFSEKFLVPDAKIGWYPLALDASRALDGEGRPVLVVATNPPASALVIGGAIARRWGAPLVLDYRDPWTTGYYQGEQPAEVQRREEGIERRLLVQASAVVTVGAGFAQRIGSLVQDQAELLNKLRVVGNGFLEESFTELGPFPFERPTLLHAGSLYHHRSPEPLLEAIALLKAQEPALWDAAELRWVGNVDRAYLDHAARLGIQNLVHEGFVEHRTALEYQLGADLLLLLTEGMLTGKVYEYLRAGRPILAIGESPDLAELLQRHGAGQVFPRDDVEGIANFIAQVLRRRQRTGPREPRPWPGVEAYERGALAAQFA